VPGIIKGIRTVLRSTIGPRQSQSAIGFEIGDPLARKGSDFRSAVWLRDQVRQSMLSAASRIWESSSSPSRCFLQPQERAMKLVSNAFAEGTAIPRRFTCDGENLSPPLQWSGAPEGSRSFVLLCDDPDAPVGTWHHWAVYDIPPAVTEFAVNAAQNTRMKQAVNDFRKVGYGGPCPPHGHGPHHYHFRLLALSMEDLPAKANASCRDIEREARKHAIAEAILIGWYER
jgi:Raf kinase inhibitor-like YbhB/YbcL family protein